MIFGGLLVFYLSLRRRGQKWRTGHGQVIGTIFFFPTLILLAVYINLSRDAVVGILGAFLGSLFSRTISNGGDGGPSTSSGNSPQRAGPQPRVGPEFAAEEPEEDESIEAIVGPSAAVRSRRRRESGEDEAEVEF